MTPAQFREARDRLGLSAAQMARALSDPDAPPSVKDPDTPAGQVAGRTVRRWEDGSQDVPGPVVVAVRAMLRAARMD